jgi:hypothetical protein
MASVVSANSQVPEKLTKEQTELRAARAAVLKVVPKAAVRDFDAVIREAVAANPSLTGSAVEGGVWTLLAGGDLVVTADRRLTRG